MARALWWILCACFAAVGCAAPDLPPLADDTTCSIPEEILPYASAWSGSRSLHVLDCFGNSGKIARQWTKEGFVSSQYDIKLNHEHDVVSRAGYFALLDLALSRLGVTPQMLVWMGKNILDPFENEHGGHGHGGHGHRLVLYANGVGEQMVARGVDFRFTKDGELASPGLANEVTFQFRETKTDQLAFGESKTLKATGKTHVCPVSGGFGADEDHMADPFWGPAHRWKESEDWRPRHCSRPRERLSWSRGWSVGPVPPYIPKVSQKMAGVPSTVHYT